MDSIKNIVSEVIGQMSSGKGRAFADIQAVWEKISKDENSRVTGFNDGCLTISAASSLRLVRLNLNREALLKELHKEFPSVVRINFKVSAVTN